MRYRMEVVTSLFDYIVSRVSSVNLFDVLDIAIVSVIFYYIFKFIRDRRAGKLAVGVVLILVFLLASDVFHMYALNFLLGNIVQVGIIGLMIVFQSELRYFLEKVGGNSLFNSINRRGDRRSATEVFKCIDAVVDACAFFSSEMTGALIVFERTTKLGDVIKSGTVIDAEPSDYMIKNIFFNKAPMHDGALVIRNYRLFSAGCFLPLSANDSINKDLGTRHRAALGMSENSDAVVVVVSEETGSISLMVEGQMQRDFSPQSLKETLVTLLLGETGKKDKKIHLLHRK